MTRTMVPSQETRSGRAPAWLLLAAVACLVAGAALYVVAVRTETGQRIDESTVESHHYDRTSAPATSAIDLSMIAALAVLAVLVATRARREPRRVAFAAAVVALSTLSAEMLRIVALGRPRLGVVDALFGPSFPSGHVAIAVSLAFGLVLCDRGRTRWAAPVAFAAAGWVTALVVFLPFHRVSDVLGSNLLVAAVVLAVLAVGGRLLRSDGSAAGERALRWSTAAAAAIGAGACAVGIAWAFASLAEVGLRDLGEAVVVGMLISVASVVLTVVLLVRVAEGPRPLT